MTANAQYILRITSGLHAGRYVGQSINWMTANPPQIGGLLVAVKRLTHDDPKEATRVGLETAQLIQADLRERGFETEMITWDAVEERIKPEAIP